MSGRAIKMFKTRSVLNFKDEKPAVFKLRQLTYPVIKEKDLVKYAANAANIPVSTMEACVAAIAEAIVYFAINGMRVVIPDFGGFYVKVATKCAKTWDDCTAENIVRTSLAYVPVTQLRDLISESNTEVVTAPFAVDYEA